MTVDIWTEPNNTNPGAAWGTGADFLPEDATTLADDLRMLFERGVANWKSVRALPRNDSSTSAEMSDCSYLSILDGAYVWSHESVNSNLWTNLVNGAGAIAPWFDPTESGESTQLTSTNAPFRAFFGERVSTSVLVGAYFLDNSGTAHVVTSDDYGNSWAAMSTPEDIPCQATTQPVMPGGSSDPVIFVGNGIWYITTSATQTDVSQTCTAVAHNGSGTILVVGESYISKSTNYGSTWTTTAMPTGPTGESTLAEITFDPKRSVFVLVRRASTGRFVISQSANGATWASWLYLPDNILTEADGGWCKLRCTTGGVWCLFYYRYLTGNVRHVAMAYSLDQGTTWRNVDLYSRPPGATGSVICNPVFVPATYAHPSYFVVTNQWDTELLHQAHELIVSGPLEPAIARTSSST